MEVLSSLSRLPLFLLVFGVVKNRRVAPLEPLATEPSSRTDRY